MQRATARVVLLLMPIALTASCIWIFNLSAHYLGDRRGYFAGFVFYWIVWCLAVPMLLVGPRAILDSFRPSRVFDYRIVLALVTLLVFVYVYAFPAALRHANEIIFLLSMLLAIVNAALEEILWRSTYMLVFGDRPWLVIGYSSVGFAIWHYAPQIIMENRNPGGAHSFVAFAFVLGLCYSYVAFRQRSIFWTTVAHAFFDLAGLGAAFYFR